MSDTARKEGDHTVETRKPAAIGPYSPVFDDGAYLFCSGQLPIDPQSGELDGPDIRTQTGRVLSNLEAALRASGSELSDVVKTTVYLKSLDDFEGMNAVYGERLASVMPARSTIGGVALPRGARIEIEAIARRASGPSGGGSSAG